jgi:hypothetical protein
VRKECDLQADVLATIVARTPVTPVTKRHAALLGSMGAAIVARGSASIR